MNHQEHEEVLGEEEEEVKVQELVVIGPVQDDRLEEHGQMI